jgi:hypothetical protein
MAVGAGNALLVKNPTAGLLLILAVANSTFVEKFYDTRFHNKLYSGRRRFITQYTSEFPLPRLESVPATEIVQLTRTLLDTEDPDARLRLETIIDEHVWQSFGVPSEAAPHAVGV